MPVVKFTSLDGFINELKADFQHIDGQIVRMERFFVPKPHCSASGVIQVGEILYFIATASARGNILQYAHPVGECRRGDKAEGKLITRAEGKRKHVKDQLTGAGVAFTFRGGIFREQADA